MKSGPAFQKANGGELTAVMRRDEAKARDFAERHGVPRWYTDANELIHDPEVDAVYIATPPGSHRDLALAVAKAGKPCYVEKPMARNHAECQEMISAFQQADLPLFVAYYRRCLPRFVEVKQLLEQDRLGTLTKIRYRLASSAYRNVDSNNLPWRLQPEHSGGGLLWDLGSHLIDLLDHLFGPLKNIRGESRNVSMVIPLPDQTALEFSTPGGVHGEAYWDFASDAQADLLEITGEAGSLRLSCFGNEPLTLEIAGQTSQIERPNPAHVHQPLVQTMIDELLGKGGPCPSTGVSAARASRIIDAIG